MKKSLMIGALALGLFAFGCDDESDAGGTDARADGGGDAGDGGRLDGARDGGDGGRLDVSSPDGQFDGGDAAEVSSPPVDAVADMSTGSPDTAVIGDAGPNPFAVCRSSDMSGVSAAAFCNHVMTTCGFGSGPGKFTDTGNCVFRYNSYNAQQKSCSAYHACVAGTSAQNAILHCPHPAGAPSNNPCDLPL